MSREFTSDFTRHIVPYAEILSGGPPKDGIPAIDRPHFVSVREAQAWIRPQEPVVMVTVDQVIKAYPLQILIWHEIVNDEIDGVSVTVTFCPLCNTAIAFNREFDGRILDFGTTGRLRYSNLIMYDRQTETWWQQATGEGIAGVYAGRRLEFLSANIVGWADFAASHPDAWVLSRDTGFQRSYGSNPYQGYDDVNRSPFLYHGPRTPDRLPTMARVLTVELDSVAIAYPYEILMEQKVVGDIIAGVPVVILWKTGIVSALDSASIASGRDVGAAAVFDRRVDGHELGFEWREGAFHDLETGSTWNLLGEAESGALTGKKLTPLVSIDHFWFSWAAFKPETQIYEAP